MRKPKIAGELVEKMNKMKSKGSKKKMTLKKFAAKKGKK